MKKARGRECRSSTKGSSREAFGLVAYAFRLDYSHMLIMVIFPSGSLIEHNPST